MTTLGSGRYKSIALMAAIVLVSSLLVIHRTSTVVSDLPDIMLPRLSDPERQTRLTELRGEPGILNFWASWCVACRDEHSILMNLGEGNVRVVGVNFRDDRSQALRWIEFYGDPYRFSLYDSAGALGAKLAVDALPVTFVIDADGRIAYRHLGPLDSSIVEEVITPLLADANRRGETNAITLD